MSPRAVAALPVGNLTNYQLAFASTGNNTGYRQELVLVGISYYSTGIDLVKICRILITELCPEDFMSHTV